MASSKEYKDYVLEQCGSLVARPMMGEFLLYYKDKLVGGIYDNRLLLKPTKTLLAKFPNPNYAIPYEGAKAMVEIDNFEDKELLKVLFESVFSDLKK